MEKFPNGTKACHSHGGRIISVSPSISAWIPNPTMDSQRITTIDMLKLPVGWYCNTRHYEDTMGICHGSTVLVDDLLGYGNA